MKIDLILPRPHEAQQHILDNAGRFNVIDAGRRFGKSQMDINEAAPMLLAGQRVGAFFPTYKMLSETWREFLNVFRPLQRAKNETENRLELITGGLLEMWSLENPDTARGRKYDRVIIDEAAQVKALEEVWPMIIRPMLADTRGDAFIKSTPRGRNGFWQLFQRGVSGEPGYKSFQYPTSANPYIHPEEIEAMRREMPEITFRQEVLAEFIDDLGGVFRRVREAVFGVQLTDPVEGRQYSASVDVASSVDYTVVAIWDDAERKAVHIDRFNRVDYNVLEDRLFAAYQRWNLRAMTIEANSIGQAVIDHLRGRGMNIIPFTTTAASKQAIIQGLQAAFENGEIGIPDDQVLIGELLSFEGKRNASGSFSYSAPSGQHDDTVMSLAIGWGQFAKSRRVVLFTA